MKKNVKIFLVDDDDLFPFLFREYIKETDISPEVTVFNKGKNVLDYLKDSLEKTELLPDIIFLDLNMPVMDGWEFVEEFILLKPHLLKKIKLYIFSSTISPVDIERAREIQSISEFIIKPSTPEKINAIIRSA